MSLKKSLNLLHQFLQGRTNKQQESLIDSWLEQSGATEPVPLLQDTISKEKLKTEIRENVFLHIHRQRVRNIRRNRFVRWAAAAAVITFISTTLFILSNRYVTSSQEIAWQTIEVENGHRQRITLPDGSVVTVNGGSTIKVPERFIEGNRTIYLNSGEAFFEVVKKPSHPFVVTTPHIDIAVLGTSFSIRDYSDEPEAAVLVKTGSVSVNYLQSSQTNRAHLTMGEGVRFNKLRPVLTKTSIDPALADAWTRDELVFEGKNLQYIVQVLQHRFACKIKVDNSRLLNRTFNATFRRSSLTDILQQLAIMAPLEFRTEDGVIHIR